MHGWQAWATAGSAAWLLWALFSAWVLLPGFQGRDPAAGLMLRLIQIYARLVHRLRITGLEHLPRRSPDGLGDRPLVLLANHTAGVDPILIQAALPFEIRWVMAEDMRAPALQWLWDMGRVIFVDREEGEGLGLREALRHLKAGGTLGVFPEGAIERPARQLLAFKPGAALLIARTGALVCPVLVEGTPQVDPAWASLARLSRSTLRFLPILEFSTPGAGRAARADPAAILDRLKQVFADATGWPQNPYTSRFEKGQWWYVDAEGTYHPASHFESRS
jgi:1-acyl-sn-glycerol-3-phosphate acyltransferase